MLATALFDRPAFRNVLCHGIVLGDDGRKASKSLRNFPDPAQMWDLYGSDAVRWFLMSSSILRGGNLIVGEDGIRDGVRQVLLPLWSTYYFFSLYAGAADYAATPVDEARAATLAPMDRYVLARTRELVATTTAQLDAYDIAAACEAVREHLDVLTNWYVRTQRDRFWAEDPDAFDTLWTSLEVLTRVMAPLAPLVSEEVWRGLTGGRSVHLTDWPDVENGAAADTADTALVSAMDQVRAVTSTALGLRKAAGVRVRQPLHTLTVAVDDADALAPYRDLLAAELNVKRVDLVTADAGAAERFGITQRLAVNARAAGPRLGRGVQAVIKAARAEAWRVDGDTVVVTTDDGDIALEPAEYELTTVVGGEGGAAAVLPGGGFVVLDLTLDDALRAEGYARDVVRVVQDARKAAGLQVGDRILLRLDVPEEHVAAVEQHRDTIARETLALSVEIETGPALQATVDAVEAGGYEA